MKRFMLLLAWNAILIFGALAVARNTPGPEWAGLAAGIAYIAAVGIAAFLVRHRFEGPWRDP